MVRSFQVGPAITTKYSLGIIKNIFNTEGLFSFQAILILNYFSLKSCKWTHFSSPGTVHDHSVSGQNTVDGLLKSRTNMFISRLRTGRGRGGEKGIMLGTGRACLYGQ